MKSTIFLLTSLVCGSNAGGADDPGTLLRGARSLQCLYTSSVNTFVRSGHRTIEHTTEKGTAIYDNINVIKGTARMVGNVGATDVVVWLDRIGSIWIRERTPFGNEFYGVSNLR
jgi:hypothetical protein